MPPTYLVGTNTDLAPRQNASDETPLRYHSFAGTDIKVAIRLVEKDNNGESHLYYKSFAELQTISISSSRSVSPVRRLGESQAHTYTRGARTIAGTMVFSLFSRDAFYEMYREGGYQEVLNPQEPFFLDQIPEFDVFITMANEYGLVSNAIIGGVTLTNSGGTLSVHDVYTEQTVSYVARFHIPPIENYKAINLLRQQYLEGQKAASQIAAKALSAKALNDQTRITPIPNMKESEPPLLF